MTEGYTGINSADGSLLSALEPQSWGFSEVFPTVRTTELRKPRVFATLRMKTPTLRTMMRRCAELGKPLVFTMMRINDADDDRVVGIRYRRETIPTGYCSLCRALKPITSIIPPVATSAILGRQGCRDDPRHDQRAICPQRCGYWRGQPPYKSAALKNETSAYGLLTDSAPIFSIAPFAPYRWRGRDSPSS